MARRLHVKWKNKLGVQDQNGVSPLYFLLEIHHSGLEPLKCTTTSAKLYRSPVVLVS